MTNSSPLISPEELRALLGDARLVLVDVRTGPDARARYREAHLPGALFVDMDADLAVPPDAAGRGGRHPLPHPDNVAELLGRLGIEADTRVVAYDDKQGANAAARFWWMARAAGHHDVRVLDGGLQSAIAAGIGTVDTVEQPRSVAPRRFGEWRLSTASIDDVEEAVLRGTAPVFDVREPRRYRGEHEPIDRIPGHIPGAINIPYADNLDADGRFLPPSELREKYGAALGETPPERAIVHCGSGVTACHTILAFEIAGLATPRLYVGSWSDWSNQGKPVATGERP